MVKMHKTFKVKKDGYSIVADITVVNADLLVSLTGGDLPHLGGVVTYDIKADKIEKVYFASHDGRKHKDIFLAEKFMQSIKSKLPGNACVTAGVHINGITKEQIDASYEMCDELAKQVTVWLKNNTINIQKPKYTTHLSRDQNGNLIEKGSIHDEKENYE